MKALLATRTACRFGTTGTTTTTTRALRLSLKTRTSTMTISTATTPTRLSRMQRWFPGTARPLIVSAPMAGITNPTLASEVVRAGGLGFIQGGRTFKPGSSALMQLEEQLTLARSLLLPPPAQEDEESMSLSSSDKQKQQDLPVGVGFVLFSECAGPHFGETTAPILARYRPAAVWFFAPDEERSPGTLRRVIEALRAAAAAAIADSDDSDGSGWNPRVVVQVGTVAAAREAAGLGVDVIVAQGAEAGGHQFVRAAGGFSLVPEVRDMVRNEFPDKEIAVWAAGGIADGRGVAAALALGAEAAVMGTRYMVAPESDAEEYKREALLSASDGATSTVKSYVHDHVQGNFTWPTLYDARAIVHQSYHDSQAGMTIEENVARYRAAKDKGDVSMMVTWSGSSVGLIRTAPPAADITRQVRDEAVEVIHELNASL
ncbi:FMN-dependent 2-nitropropane dioxygenase [Xylaria sp. FL0064]|nr:FMN-dependent 2-nitropropane dioxygenase [Xylaria sp. FL0064]